MGVLSTPRKLSTASGAAPSFSARAFVNFNGTGVVAIRKAGNVSSITDNGTGSYSINFLQNMPDDLFAAVVSIQKDGLTGNETGPSILTKTVSSVQVINIGYDSMYRDSSSVNVAVFG